MHFLTSAQLLDEAVMWENYAKKLREMAAMRDQFAGEFSRAEAVPVASASAGANAPAQRGERVEQIRSFLEKNGPKTVIEIVNETGIPRGSVRGVLERKGGLFESKHGKWRLKAQAQAHTSQ